MPTIPVRGLATLGILKDPSPYDLADNAWSGGSNVRFDGTTAMRAPIFRAVVDPMPAAPAFIVGYRPSSGYDQVFTMDTAGHVTSYSSGLTLNIDPLSGYTALPPTAQITSTFLGDVCYLNNPSTVPMYWGASSTTFSALPNWDPTWRCIAMRAYKDYMVALNVTKGAIPNPTMVKTSDNTLAGLPPGSWNSNDPTTNCVETPIAQMTSPIVDGCVLRDMFVIYSGNQVWAMQAVDTNDVFQFTCLFTEGGMIAPNCCVEVGGLHFVFGPHDIYKHDGSTQVSLLDKRNRKWVYNHLNNKLRNRCFAQFMPRYNEIVFAYVSSDDDAIFMSPTGCNKGAVYNIAGDTWSFIDLPNVTAMTLANLNSVMTWGQATGVTWGTMGGTWYDQVDGYAEHVVASSQALPGYLTNNRLLGYDFLDNGSLGFPYQSECNGPSFLERTGLDMVADGADITTYKKFTRIFPQVYIYRNIDVTISAGAALTSAGPVTWLPPVAYDPATDYKVDVRIGGRYLAYRFSTPSPGDYTVTGFDVDVASAGRR